MIKKTVNTFILLILATAVSGVVIYQAWPMIAPHVNPKVLESVAAVRTRLFGPATKPAPAEIKVAAPAPAAPAPAPAAAVPPKPAAPAVAAAPAPVPAPAPAPAPAPVPAPVAKAAPAPAPAPVPPSAAKPAGPAALVKTEITPESGKGCVIGGLTGTGLTVAIGPAEVAALLTGAALLPISPLAVGATLGAAFLGSCVVGAWVAPMLGN
jgi:hypothetical protein